MNASIDLNCDLGEGFGVYTLGDDAAIIPHVTSINVAAGFHAGDPTTMRKTLDIAAKYAISVGAHPGLPDRVGFGRRQMAISPEEAYDLVLYQIGAVYAFTRAAGMELTHIKPHGALYNMAAKDRPLADAIASAVHRFDWNCVLVGLAGSELIHAGEALGLKTASEGFLDRNYEADGSLTARSRSDAMLHDSDAAADRALKWLRDGFVTARTGERLQIKLETLCIHGDSPSAAAMAQRVKGLFLSNGISLTPILKKTSN